MAALITSISGGGRRPAAYEIHTMDDYTAMLGLTGIYSALTTTMGATTEPVDPSLQGLALGAYLRNSVVFACLAIRARLFGEARFQFQQLRGGRPGALFGTPDLAVLERPEPKKTTRDMLELASLDADLGGTGFLVAQPGRIKRLRPDWTYIAYGSRSRDTELGAWDPAAEIIGIGYYPGGLGVAERPTIYMPEEVAIYAPTKDPLAVNRGVGIVTAGLREVMGDNAATAYKLAFFNNAATPNLALKFPAAMSKEKALEWIELFEQEHHGAANAFRTMFLGAGVEAAPVGLTFDVMQFTELQAKAETRIAALSGMNPVVVALSEGLQGSSLNAGNFQSAARLVGDATLRPMWGTMAGALEAIVPPPPGSRLWTDDKAVAFLRSDVGDQAKITQTNGQTIGQYIKHGFTPASAIDAVVSDDPTRLVHTGLVSVQLQAPGAAMPASGAAAAMATSPDRGTIPAASRLPSWPVAEVRATRDFWPVGGSLSTLPAIAEGTVLTTDSPYVREFPSLFEPVSGDLASRVRRLRGSGATVAEIAATVDRSDRQVRRLLAATAS